MWERAWAEDRRVKNCTDALDRVAEFQRKIKPFFTMVGVRVVLKFRVEKLWLTDRSALYIGSATMVLRTCMKKTRKRIGSWVGRGRFKKKIRNERTISLGDLRAT